MKHTVTLTERRPRVMRLPRTEIAFLLGPARHLIDLAPTAERNRYQLTPRGYVGFLNGPGVRYVIRSKVPWPNLRLILGLAPDPAGAPWCATGDLLAVLATEFADRLEVATKGGLLAGYGETSTIATYPRGKLRTADHMRDPASGAVSDGSQIDEQVFDLNTHWNQLPKATATALLRAPLPVAVRTRIEAAAAPLAPVADVPPTEPAFAAAYGDPRAAGYHPLLDVCRLILHGLACADPTGQEGVSFLIDLGNAFERYITTELARELSRKPLWRVEAHPSYALGPTVLTPDILLRKAGVPQVVLDAKWKAAAPDAADLHQVLAYAAMTGAPRAGLIYPGRTDARETFAIPDEKVRVSRHCVRVIGTPAELQQSLALLARGVRRG
ncbi:MAG: McrC family protein [Gemmata sp.]